MPGFNPEGMTDEEVSLVTQYVNTVPPADILAYLEENDCFTEQAWFEAFRERLELSLFVALCTAYAHAKGELPNWRLTVPEVGKDA